MPKIVIGIVLGEMQFKCHTCENDLLINMLRYRHINQSNLFIRQPKMNIYETPKSCLLFSDWHCLLMFWIKSPFTYPCCIYSWPPIVFLANFENFSLSLNTLWQIACQTWPCLVFWREFLQVLNYTVNDSES